VNSRLQWLVITLAAVIGLAGGIYVALSKAGAASEAKTIAALYATTLPDLEARPQSLAQWKDKTLLVNYWATWCVPCRTEVPELIRIQALSSSKNVQIVGIALDNPPEVQAFAKSLAINYPVLIGALGNIDLTRALGNKSGALPFTVVISPGGGILRSHLGALTEAEAQALIAEAKTADPVKAR
jgi:thiol-disulfide isomerase/thioredoxin